MIKTNNTMSLRGVPDEAIYTNSWIATLSLAMTVINK